MAVTVQETGKYDSETSGVSKEFNFTDNKISGKKTAAGKQYKGIKSVLLWLLLLIQSHHLKLLSYNPISSYNTI